jgi:hypothetical protein
MIPDLEIRTISVQTSWPGATPQDVEKEIVIEQEEYLRGIPNLRRMVSIASTGQAGTQAPHWIHNSRLKRMPPPGRSRRAPVGQTAAQGAGWQARQVTATKPVESPPAE